MTAHPALVVEALSKHFPHRRGMFALRRPPHRAVDGVSFDVAPGETLGLVGESGCGKSTVARLIMRMMEPTGGSVQVDGRAIATLLPSEVLAYRRRVQMVFQDPYSSLNPRMKVSELIGEPLRIHGLAAGRAVGARVAELAAQVGLPAASLARYPHEFSGGQRQRVAIARALAVSPQVLVADEPVSALDVSVRAQVLNLLADLQERHGLSYLFISHDIATVAYLSHRVAVMYLGAIAEIGPAKAVLGHPLHPYTRLLLDAVPVSHPRHRARRMVLRGEVPTGGAPGTSCRFAPRCPMAADRCRVEEPLPRTLAPGRLVACHFAEATAALTEGDVP